MRTPITVSEPLVPFQSNVTVGSLAAGNDLAGGHPERASSRSLSVAIAASSRSGF